MPLPTPNKGEKYKSFVKRFLKNKEAKRKFPEISQRFAVMVSQWRSK